MRLLWKVDITHVKFIKTEYESQARANSYVNRQSWNAFGGGGHGNNNNSNTEICYDDALLREPATTYIDLGLKKAYTKIGLYKGNIVAIKTAFLPRKNGDLPRNICKELKQVSTLCEIPATGLLLAFPFCVGSFYYTSDVRCIYRQRMVYYTLMCHADDRDPP